MLIYKVVETSQVDDLSLEKYSIPGPLMAGNLKGYTLPCVTLVAAQEWLLLLLPVKKRISPANKGDPPETEPHRLGNTKVLQMFLIV